MLLEPKAITKDLLPVYDRPIIELVIREAISAGITKFDWRSFDCGSMEGYVEATNFY